MKNIISLSLQTKLLIGLGLLLFMLAIISVIFAAPPATPYELGETLTPNCAPGSVNCNVVTPAASGNNSDITDLEGLTEDVTFPQNVGIGRDPVESLDIRDGNILLSTDNPSELNREIQWWWDGNSFSENIAGAPYTVSEPIFKLGRVVLGGIGTPVLRFMFSGLYDDDGAGPNPPVYGEQSVFEIENTGTVASVRAPTNRGSHFEGFFAGESAPLFRINSFPDMQLEFGPGGAVDTDIVLKRFTDSLTAASGWLFSTNGGDRVKITNNGLGVNASNVDVSFVSGGAIALHDNNEAIINIPSGGLALSVGDRSFVRLTSDCTVAATCTFTLNPGTFGQLITLQWDDNANVAQLLDSGAVRLSADWIPGEFDTLSLIDTYDNDTAAHYWVELSRSNN